MKQTMKLIFILPGLICLLTLSCSEDIDNIEKQVGILYEDIIPNIEIQTVRSMSQTTCGYEHATPSDSTVIYELDLNRDNKNDYRFIIEHYEADCSCAATTYEMSIEGLDSNNLIATVNNGVGVMTLIRVFQELDTIDTNNSWVNEGTIFYTPACYHPIGNGVKDGFYGVKIGNYFGFIQVGAIPNNGISILSKGFNKKVNSFIYCGQKE